MKNWNQKAPEGQALKRAVSTSEMPMACACSRSSYTSNKLVYYFVRAAVKVPQTACESAYQYSRISYMFVFIGCAGLCCWAFL